MRVLTSPRWLDLTFSLCLLPLHLGLRASCISAEPISQALLAQSSSDRGGVIRRFAHPPLTRASAVICLAIGNLTSCISLIAINCLATYQHLVHCARHPIASILWIPPRCAGQLALTTTTLFIAVAATCASLPIAMVSPPLFFHCLGIGAKVL